MLDYDVKQCDIGSMSKRLQEAIRQYTDKGTANVGRLMEVSNRGEQAVLRWAKGESKPPRSLHFQIALACGLSEQEALEVVNEGLHKATEKAS